MRHTLAVLAVLAAHLAVVALAIPAVAAPEAPTVVSMTPTNGATDVDPATKQIRITFSEPMRDQAWSVVGGGAALPVIKGIRYLEGGTVLAMDVLLKPGREYRFALNSSTHQNFRSRKGVALAPVRVTFRTTGTPPVPEGVRTGMKLAFDLLDVNGVRVRSQDYAGVPIFLVFGACW